MQQLFDAYQKDGKPQPLSDLQIAEKISEYTREAGGNAIHSSIKSNSTGCVELLYNQLKKTNHEIGEKQLFSHLLHAIKSNHPPMVNFFVNEIKQLPKATQNHLYNSINMGINQVEQTDLSILRNLIANGVKFSETAQAVIDLKEDRPIGFLLPIGIMLNKITDFFKESVPVWDNNSIIANVRNFKELKKQCVDIKESEAKSEVSEGGKYNI
ncbi:hypothetical protein [uncultured Legionella sp.]|uniref:hypothetical protein n=1 Tax=uncultured Legionella sp. TaxID=210934 RepID=UPI00261AE9DF|nr:hypothetical protein [uncultured Legionella sp.]